MTLTTENIALAAARAVAPLIGATVTGAEDDTWRGRMALPCGLEIIMAKPYGSKGEIWAYLPRPGYPGESRKCGVIGADLTKDPAKLARDIERRLLPVAQEKAADWRAVWASQEAGRANLEALAAEFAAIPGVRVQVEKPGSGDQHLRVRYYETDKGSLAATVYASGSVYIDSASVSGQTDKLKAVIAALRA